MPEISLNSFRNMIGKYNAGQVKIEGEQLKKVNNGFFARALSFFCPKPSAEENQKVRLAFYNAISNDVNLEFSQNGSKETDAFLKSIRKELGITDNSGVQQISNKSLSRAQVKTLIGKYDEFRFLGRNIANRLQADLGKYASENYPGVDLNNLKSYLNDPSRTDAKYDIGRNCLKLIGKLSDGISPSKDAKNLEENVELTLDTFKDNQLKEIFSNNILKDIKTAKADLKTVISDSQFKKTFKNTFLSVMNNSMRTALDKGIDDDYMSTVSDSNIKRYVARYENFIIGASLSEGPLPSDDKISRAEIYAKKLAEKMFGNGDFRTVHYDVDESSADIYGDDNDPADRESSFSDFGINDTASENISNRNSVASDIQDDSDLTDNISVKISSARDLIKEGNLDDGFKEAVRTGTGKAFDDLPKCIRVSDTVNGFSFINTIDDLTEPGNLEFKMANPLTASFKHELDRSLARLEKSGINEVSTPDQKAYLARRASYFTGISNYVMDELKKLVDKKIKEGFNTSLNDSIGKAFPGLMRDPDFMKEISDIVHRKYQYVIEDKDNSTGAFLLAQQIGCEDDPDFGRAGDDGEEPPENFMEKVMVKTGLNENAGVDRSYPSHGVTENLANDCIAYARNARGIEELLEKHGLPPHLFA